MNTFLVIFGLGFYGETERSSRRNGTMGTGTHTKCRKRCHEHDWHDAQASSKITWGHCSADAEYTSPAQSCDSSVVLG